MWFTQSFLGYKWRVMLSRHSHTIGLDLQRESKQSAALVRRSSGSLA
jgi:hypothetical protein